MPQGAGANPLLNFLPLILIFIVFYLLLIRPQKAKEREHQNMINKLAKNDEVVTTGGIHGIVVNVKDKTLTLRVDDNVKIELEKNCIAYVKKTASVNSAA
jgi:preprotein translocase subunit YajC